MITPNRYTVIGAGHGGRAMAAHLALMGRDVTLYNRTPEHIAGVRARRGIDLESYDGGPRGFARLNCVTSDMAEAVADAQVIMVVVPSSAHADVATAAAPHLKDGQIIVLHPGRTLGALEFHKALTVAGCTADVTVSERNFHLRQPLEARRNRASSASRRPCRSQHYRPRGRRRSWKQSPRPIRSSLTA
jgi:opine dehydrogenase